MAAVIADDISTIIFVSELLRAFIIISLELVSRDPINNIISTGSGNDLAPNRQEIIIGTNDGVFNWSI